MGLGRTTAWYRFNSSNSSYGIDGMDGAAEEVHCRSPTQMAYDARDVLIHKFEETYGVTLYPTVSTTSAGSDSPMVNNDFYLSMGNDLETVIQVCPSDELDGEMSDHSVLVANNWNLNVRSMANHINLHITSQVQQNIAIFDYA